MPSFKFDWSLTISLMEIQSFIHPDDQANRKPEILISNFAKLMYVQLNSMNLAHNILKINNYCQSFKQNVNRHLISLGV